MVFEKLTLVEISLDGAQIGPRTMGAGEEPSESTEDEAAEGRGRGRWRLFAVSLLLALVATGVAVGWQRLRGGETTVDVDVEDLEAEYTPAS